MNNLTTIAALPQGGGCLAKLPAEVGRAPVVVMRAPYFQHIGEEDETPLEWADRYQAWYKETYGAKE